MKHSAKITIILVTMFFIAQLLGIYIAGVYSPQTLEVYNETSGTYQNITETNLPYGITPPEEVSPQASVFSILIALFIAVILMLTLMKFRAETFLRLWFFVVVTIGIALALNAIFISVPNSSTLALVIALPLAIIKIFKRNIIIHNFTEVLIYPGVASIFIPLLNIWTMVLLLILISAYDIYAVWHSGFMQKMAKYQIETLKIFSGFFVPYLGKKEREAIKKAKKSKSKKKVGVNIAILGGGDVVFPIILAGVVLNTLGLIQAIVVAISATIALSILLYMSEKGKFYPAMPFISAGCLAGLLVAYLI